MDELNEYGMYSDDDIEEMLSEYYEIMDITDEQKEKRKKLAKELRNALLFLFALLRAAIEYEYIQYEYILVQFRNEFEDIVVKYGRVDAYFAVYVDKITSEIVDTTIRRYTIENPYWLSDARALEIAENESNSILNYEELQEAIDNGYTKKTWKAEIDNRTRKDHIKMNNKTIPIEDMFQFPDCEMIAPHDEINGTAEQVVNCRCSVSFS